MKFKEILNKILNFLLFIGILGIIIVVIIQILGRTPLMTKAPHWTEELSRMIFVFVVSIGAIVATINNEFVAVDLLTSKLKGKALIIYNLIMNVFIMIFFFCLYPACIKFVKIGAKQLSPSLRINMSYIHFFILIAIIGMGVGKIFNIVENVKTLKNYKVGEIDG